MRIVKLRIIILLSSILFLGSFIAEIYKKTPYDLIVHSGIPLPLIPADNELTEERVELGKMLFYDKILSKDKSLSCASCHNPDYAFSDNKPLSKGVKDSVGERNSMPLINLAWSNTFFWDGGATSLELQAIGPISNPKEMNLPLQDAVDRLNKSEIYPSLFIKAYGSKPTLNLLCKAIASFERSLISFNSKFDKFYYSGDSSLFTESELRGYDIFFNDNYKMHCASCHSGVNFTNDSYQNNGLYLDYKDHGRYKITGNPKDRDKFKVPTLRNIALTAPYMHDGSLKTLEEVIDHYNTIGPGAAHPNISQHVHAHSGQSLTESEKTDLVNFLKTLTDEEFVSNSKFRID